MKGKEEAFGYHLMLDCYQCDNSRLGSIDYCYQFLDELTQEIEMEKQALPVVFRTPEKFEGKAGLSGWVPIVESGISIHTLTETNFVSIDVYSCKEFSNDTVVNFTKNFFEPREIEENFLKRGTKYFE